MKASVVKSRVRAKWRVAFNDELTNARQKRWKLIWCRFPNRNYDDGSHFQRDECARWWEMCGSNVVRFSSNSFATFWTGSTFHKLFKSKYMFNQKRPHLASLSILCVSGSINIQFWTGSHEWYLKEQFKKLNWFMKWVKLIPNIFEPDQISNFLLKTVFFLFLNHSLNAHNLHDKEI